MSSPPKPLSPERIAYPVELQAQVEAYLEGLEFTGRDDTRGLAEAMRYSLLAGGKRVRPVLALAAADALGHPASEMLPLAGAIELIHTYSLIHDDLPAMDDDELRRGRPTCHVAFGEDVAILAGDGLFAEAMWLVLACQPGEPALVLAALRELVSAAGVGGMVGGQYLDVTASGELDGAALSRLQSLKTGRLIAASVDCVSLVSGMDGPVTMALGRFAAELGTLFQIVDDILDVTGDEAAIGKPRGSDERHGKPTYVSVFGLERATELAEESHGRAREALAHAGPRTGKLEQINDYILTRRR
jgi:geranylgeranyl diphosphate synthase type II